MVFDFPPDWPVNIWQRLITRPTSWPTPHPARSHLRTFTTCHSHEKKTNKSVCPEENRKRSPRRKKRNKREESDKFGRKKNEKISRRHPFSESNRSAGDGGDLGGRAQRTARLTKMFCRWREKIDISAVFQPVSSNFA